VVAAPGSASVQSSAHGLETTIGLLDARLGGRASRALVPDHAQALSDWGQWCERHEGSHCQLALSSHWLLTFAATPNGPGRLSHQALQDQAAQQWTHYLGLSPAALSDGWMLRSLSTGAGELVCAAPRALMDDLLNVARECGVKLVWVGPWWARGAERWFEAGDALTISHELHALEPGLVTCLRAQRETSSSPWRLTQVWTEVADDAMNAKAQGMAADAKVMALPEPGALPGHGEQGYPCLWDHSEAVQVLASGQGAWSHVQGQGGA